MTIGSAQAPYRIFANLFCTWDGATLRLGRIVWRRGKPGAGGWTSALSWALTRRVFLWRREWAGWLLVLCGLRIHYQRAYGGHLT